MKKNKYLNYDDNVLIKIELLNKNKIYDSFSKPLDLIINKTIKDVSILFLNEFNPSTIYTHNNKMLILFKSNFNEIKKYIKNYTIITNDYLNENDVFFLNDDVEFKLINKNKESSMYFDFQEGKIKTIENEKIKDVVYEKLIINNFIYNSNLEKMFSMFSSFINNNFNKELLKNINTFKEANKTSYKSKVINEYLVSLHNNVLFNVFFNFEFLYYKNDNQIIDKMVSFQKDEINFFRNNYFNFYQKDNLDLEKIKEMYERLDNYLKIGSYLKLKCDNSIKLIVEELKNTQKNINFIKKLKLKN